MKPFLGIVMVFGLSGCQYDPHAHTYTTTQPSADEITGVYELSLIYMDRYARGLREKVEDLPSRPTLLISPDGRFSATQFPYFSEGREGVEYRFEDFRSLEGRWEQVVVGGIADGTGSIKDHQGVCLLGLPLHLQSPGFTGTTKVDGLIFGFGDPDSGDARRSAKEVRWWHRKNASR